jgi:hypothetical protein
MFDFALISSWPVTVRPQLKYMLLFLTSKFIYGRTVSSVGV